jgi:hypothetical protein
VVSFTFGERAPGAYCKGGWARPQSRSGRYGKEKNLLLLPGIEPRSSSLLTSRYTDRTIPALSALYCGGTKCEGRRKKNARQKRSEKGREVVEKEAKNMAKKQEVPWKTTRCFPLGRAENDASNNSSVAAYICCRRNVYTRHCLATIARYIDTQTDGKDFMKYVVDMDSGAVIYTPSFINTGLGIQKLMGGFPDTQNRHLLSLLKLF